MPKLHSLKTINGYKSYSYPALVGTIEDQKRKLDELELELAGLREFKRYFDELYGTGLEIIGWHLNGEPESFDSFYEDACGGME